MKIAVHIERLVLDGLAITPAQADRLRIALQAELSAQLAAGGISDELARGIAVPHLGGGSLDAVLRSAPEETGREIGQAIYRGIGRPTGATNRRYSEAATPGQPPTMSGGKDG